MTEQGNEHEAAEESSLEREPDDGRQPGAAESSEAGGYGGPGPENEAAAPVDTGDGEPG